MGQRLKACTTDRSGRAGDTENSKQGESKYQVSVCELDRGYSHCSQRGNSDRERKSGTDLWVLGSSVRF